MQLLFCVTLAVTAAEHRGVDGAWMKTPPLLNPSYMPGSDVTSKEAHVRFEVFTAVTLKNAVFWDIKIQFVLHRRHITSLLQSPAS
jgi:hypothetical protein